MSDQAPAAPAAPVADTSAAETPSTESDILLDDSGSEGTSTPSTDSKVPAKEVAAAAKKVDAEKVAPNKFKVTIDGVEEELTQDQLVKYAQKGKAADKRFQESAQIKKEAAELIRMLRESPERVLADPAILGGDDKVLEFAQKLLAKKIEDERKPEHVREQERLVRELEEERSARKRENESRAQQEYDNMVKAHENQLEEGIQSAMESSGLPKSPYVLKKLVDVMQSALELGKDITPKQAMEIVKREQRKDLRAHFDASPEDMLEELLGGDNIKRLRKRQVAKIKAETPSAVPTAPAKVSMHKSQDSETTDKKSVRDWLRGR